MDRPLNLLFRLSLNLRLHGNPSERIIQVDFVAVNNPDNNTDIQYGNLSTVKGKHITMCFGKVDLAVSKDFLQNANGV